METVLTRARRLEERRSPRESWRAADGETFERVLLENRRTVYLIALRLLGGHDEADEATQIAFLRAWQARGKFRGASSVRTWLVRIVLNVAKSMRAARGRVAGPADLSDLADAAPGGEERLRLRQVRGRVRRAVSALPERQREVVLLRVFSELSCRETAEVMGLSEGAVKAHLHQAVGNLRRLLRVEPATEKRR